MKPGGHVAADASVRLALQQSLHLTFVALLAVALAVAVSMLFVPPVKIGRAIGVPAGEAIQRRFTPASHRLPDPGRERQAAPLCYRFCAASHERGAPSG